jgi:hypothetical protein
MQVEARSSRSQWFAGCLAVLLGLLMVPSLAGAQSLAEAAKREEARRKAAASKGEVKTYTNKDLAGGEAKSSQTITTPAPAAPATQAEAPPTTEPPDPTKDEKYWRDRMADARARLAQNQVMLAALESRVNALMTDFVNRDDPAQKAAIADDRGKAIGQMNRVKQDIEKITKEIADIEEEARKAGVPAGWLR